MTEEKSYEVKQMMLKYVGRIYRESQRKAELALKGDCVREVSPRDQASINLVRYIDRALRDCSGDTQLIIRREYLEISSPTWWQEKYAKSTFYRLKKEAVQEFMHCLDL
ncbi:MAG TPA: hypothetical protein DHW39_01000 [Erysipelotrichaceae bacterium]|jgi:hypothetical protein|nr:hypothetical protein [Erysipelotrichaceae bacterium]